MGGGDTALAYAIARSGTEKPKKLELKC